VDHGELWLGLGYGIGMGFWLGVLVSLWTLRKRHVRE
jgi:hypothetical protein